MAIPVLNTIVSQIELAKANHDGKTCPYGFVKNLLSKQKKMYPWLMKDHVYNHIKRLMKQANDKLSNGISIGITASTSAPNEVSIKSLTSLSTLSHSENDNQPITTAMATLNTTTATNGEVMHEVTLAITISQELTGLTCVGTDENGENVETTTTAMTTQHTTTATSTKPHGQPIGTTTNAKLDLAHHVALTRKEAAEQFYAAQQTARQQRKRLEKGTLAQIIKSCHETNSLPQEIQICPETVCTRAKKTNFKMQTHPGTVSPLAAIEPYIVALMIQCARMCAPINCKEGLELINSIISGASTLASINTWRQTHCSNFRTSETLKLSAGYWANSKKRNDQLLSAKHGVKFDSNRDDWCTYPNFVNMYAKMYEEMWKSGIATKLDTPVWLSKEGKIVELQEDAWGLKTSYLLTRPDKLLFVDEVGSNTSQSKDGNVGGQKFMCEKNGRPQQRSATKDAHFTVLGFTAATGEPVMCAIIFAAKELDPAWVIGLDPFAPWIGNEDNVTDNCGPNNIRGAGTSSLVPLVKVT